MISVFTLWNILIVTTKIIKGKLSNIFFSLTTTSVVTTVRLKQWFSKWVESPPWGRFWRKRGRTKQRRR